MRLPFSVALLGLIRLVRSTASSGYLYIFDPDLPAVHDQVPSLSPDAAKLLISQRLGVSQFHSLKDADEQTISFLNKNSSPQRLLSISENEGGRMTRLLVVVEGVEDADGRASIFPQDVKPSFHMTDPPHPSFNEKLVRALSDQLSQLSSKQNTCTSKEEDDSYFVHVSGTRASSDQCCPSLSKHLQQGDSSPGRSPGDKLESLRKINELISKGLGYWCGNDVTAVVYISGLNLLAKTEGISSSTYAKGASLVSQALNSLTNLSKTGEQQSVVLLLPPQTKKVKRSVDPYGETVFLPRGAAPLQEPSEKPLEPPTPAPSPGSMAEPKPSQPQTPKASSPPRKVYSLCHSSLDACNSATNNCSGHGSCHKKYGFSGADGKSDDAGKGCYACRCAPTVTRDSDTRVKTIYWGGNACQKKDVSMPFFLLAGITIFIVGAISWGIGMIFSIGKEPLPGVLGAGVSGPRAR